MLANEEKHPPDETVQHPVAFTSYYTVVNLLLCAVGGASHTGASLSAFIFLIGVGACMCVCVAARTYSRACVCVLGGSGTEHDLLRRTRKGLLC